MFINKNSQIDQNIHGNENQKQGSCRRAPKLKEGTQASQLYFSARFSILRLLTDSSRRDEKASLYASSGGGRADAGGRISARVDKMSPIFCVKFAFIPRKVHLKEEMGGR